ncbi:hypothetical protein LJC10_00550 [Selenomonadales bacterium OttesenSCG-928-I06]|nr:hypothetical protein [Selenomonadales bacterium OttesenSCG-928-I06]
MTKTLEVKRFKVKYKGELYGPGTENGPIIPNVNDKIADTLIKNAVGGAIVERAKAKPPINKGDKPKSGDETENENEKGENGVDIPDVDPEDTQGD